MNIPEENVISDGTFPKDNIPGLPLAAIICIAIVIYGLFVLICVFARQVILNRRPLDELESLHCCDCLFFLPRPKIKFCDIPCGQSGKTEVPPCKLDFKWLWAALPSVRCRLPESAPGPSCWPPTLPAAECPTSVRCCGLEIRRYDTGPHMVDASVPGGDTLQSPASVTGASRAAAAAAAGRLTLHASELHMISSRHYSHHPADSSPYSMRSAVLGTAESDDFKHRTADLGDYNGRHATDLGDYSRHTESDSGDYSRHTAVDSGDCTDRTADSSKYSQHRVMLDPAALLEPAPSASQPPPPGTRLHTAVE